MMNIALLMIRLKRSNKNQSWTKIDMKMTWMLMTITMKVFHRMNIIIYKLNHNKNHRNLKHLLEIIIEKSSIYGHFLQINLNQLKEKD